ncbi:MAG: ribokinase [Clostridiales bacterium]|nr:ribokinase [Clostridiales bacterium]
MKKLAVIGSINMDMTAEAERMPGRGETVAAQGLAYYPGGKGANQAVAAARLGAKVAMYGCVGDDAFADALINNLEKNGVDATRVERLKGTPSGMAIITVAQGDNSILVVSGANGKVTREYVDAQWESISQADIIILQNEIPMETVRHAIELGHEAGKYIIYNPAPAAEISPEILDKVSCLTPNEHEAALIFGTEKDIPALLKEYPEKLIVTLGEKGAAMARADGTVLEIPAMKARVADTTGAGDTFIGALACALAEDRSLDDAIRFANTASGLSVQKPGAQGGMPTRTEVEAVLQKNP